MKRETPLFIIDTKKSHKKGECDFLVCTDKDNAFVARIDYIAETTAEIGEDYRIDYTRNGMSLKLSIIRMLGNNPNRTNLRTLMKRGLDYYAEAVALTFDHRTITTEQCIEFLDKLITGNRHHLQEAGADFNELVVVKSSLMMLEAAKQKLQTL